MGYFWIIKKMVPGDEKAGKMKFKKISNASRICCKLRLQLFYEMIIKLKNRNHPSRRIKNPDRKTSEGWKHSNAETKKISWVVRALLVVALLRTTCNKKHVGDGMGLGSCTLPKPDLQLPMHSSGSTCTKWWHAHNPSTLWYWKRQMLLSQAAY